MSEYVMSDLHGCYDKFISMLEKINFSDNDRLHIIGDVFDRGPEPLKLLDYVVAHKNIYLMKGNHELMFEECYPHDMQLWMYNGAATTLNQINEGKYFTIDALREYIKSLPVIKSFDKFILVHAGLYFPADYNNLGIHEFLYIQDDDTCLWSRQNINKEVPYKDYTVICGHTPVQSITGSMENPRILHRPGHIYIDCGCVFPGGRLACLRLDDMQEFYI